MADQSPSRIDYARRHTRFGWWSLLLFAGLGFLLETLHGFKVPAYVHAANEARRLTWTLAHAHGALLGVIHILFGLSLRVRPEFGRANRTLISRCLVGATILLPGGFFLGGIAIYGGDPGLGTLLVPAGATLLLIALFLMGRASS
jgi:hypothetical protein